MSLLTGPLKLKSEETEVEGCPDDAKTNVILKAWLGYQRSNIDPK